MSLKTLGSVFKFLRILTPLRFKFASILQENSLIFPCAILNLVCPTVIN